MTDLLSPLGDSKQEKKNSGKALYFNYSWEFDQLTSIFDSCVVDSAKEKSPRS